MIISENKEPNLEEFKQLVYTANDILNSEIAPTLNTIEHAGRNLEGVVLTAMNQAAKGTKFEGTLDLISGQKFPDIVAGKFYGVEVKSTKDDKWETIGNSVNETTRVKDVKRIFIIFGKLANHVEFRTRPYEECLSEVVVTHYPRYKIDMDLPENQTIFNKIGIEYDELRNLDNPIEPIVSYYRKQLKDGETLWWINDGKVMDTVAPMKIRLWRTLSDEEKEAFTIEAFLLFPCILHSGKKKYEPLSLWLVSRYGIVSTSMRDIFTAGGKVNIGKFKAVPQIFAKINKFKSSIVKNILTADEITLRQTWKVNEISANRVEQWITIASSKNASYGNLLKFILL
jgi:hypothetical protein